MNGAQQSPKLRTQRAGTDLPVVALVGRPNVGKSTLFNSLTQSRDALVAPVPGVTRDRRERIVERDGFRFRLVDTGGVPFDKLAAFGSDIERQIASALASASVVWVLVDAAEGLNPYDAELARRIQTSGTPWLAIANKAEGPERLGRLGEFYRLGAPKVIAVSALHRRGLQEALEASAELVPALRRAPAERVEVHPTSTEPSTPGSADRAPDAMAAAAAPALADAVPGGTIHVAFVGRPNVGKSSLVNAILGEPRFIVSDVPGTTREAVDVLVEVEGESYALVDTAGLRRKARTTEYLDKLSAVNTLQALDRADVAVLVLDASEASVDQDARIAGHILERNRACVVALNKWDRVQEGERRGADVQGDIEHALKFLSLAEPVRVSALKSTGLRHLFRAIRVAYRQFSRTVPTADLNRALQIITRHTPPPSRGKAPSRIFYGTQTGTRPPSFKVFTNHPDQIRAEYTRFLEHQLRYHFGFEGTPLHIEWSGREGKAPPAESKDDAAGPAPRRRPAHPGPRHRPELSKRQSRVRKAKPGGNPRGKPKIKPTRKAGRNRPR